MNPPLLRVVSPTNDALTDAAEGAPDAVDQRVVLVAAAATGKAAPVSGCHGQAWRLPGYSWPVSHVWGRNAPWIYLSYNFTSTLFRPEKWLLHLLVRKEDLWRKAFEKCKETVLEINCSKYYFFISIFFCCIFIFIWLILLGIFTKKYLRFFRGIHSLRKKNVFIQKYLSFLDKFFFEEITIFQSNTWIFLQKYF